MEFYDIEQQARLEQEASSSIFFNYHDITKDDMSNGEGLRVVLWFAGCSHRCPGCHNPETWSPQSGIPFTAWDESELFEALSKDYIQGITFSGGDPLFRSNRSAFVTLLKKIKKKFPDKDVWVYTGYTLTKRDGTWMFEDTCPWLKEHDQFKPDFLEMVDVIVDGPFYKEIRENDLKLKTDPHWCGSSNQRVINVKETLRTGNIVIGG